MQMADNRRGLNMQGLDALELRTSKPSGEAWEFRKKPDRQATENLARERRPLWLIGCPPCTGFLIFQPGFQRCPVEHKQCCKHHARSSYPLTICHSAISIALGIPALLPARTSSWCSQLSEARDEGLDGFPRRVGCDWPSTPKWRNNTWPGRRRTAGLESDAVAQQLQAHAR